MLAQAAKSFGDNSRFRPLGLSGFEISPDINLDSSNDFAIGIATEFEEAKNNFTKNLNHL